MLVTRTARQAIGAISCAVLMGLGLLGGSAAATPAAGPGQGTQNWQVEVGAQTQRGSIQTMGFYPGQITVDQGDSVTWTANSAEPHTVTFLSTVTPCPATALCALPQGFDLSSPVQSTPQGDTSYDGTSYYNSGLMTTASPGPGIPFPPNLPLVHSYTLNFPATLAAGTYTYYCLVHGQAMVGTVVVQPAGTAYPTTQSEIDAANAQQIHADLKSGAALRTQTRRQDRKLSTGHHPIIIVGAMNQRAMLMRFVGPADKVNVGDRVTFRSTSMGEPHTVTFGDPVAGCGTPPCNPEQPWNVLPTEHANLHADYPATNGDFTGSPAALNSGIMLGLPSALTHLPKALSIRFTKAGHYGYICALHAYFGMVGTIHVHHRAHRHHHGHHHH